MKINYLQQGGYVPPFTHFNPLAIPTASDTQDESSNTSSSGSSEDITDKDLLKMLEKLDGLPNDMQAVTKALQSFYIDQKYGTLPSTQGIASRYLNALNMMKQANYSRKTYDKAFDIIKANGGLNEVAVDEHGELFCVNLANPLDFKKVTVSEYKEIKDKYRALTNAELLQQRAYNPKLTQQDSLQSIIAQGVGMEGITKHINTVISKLGSDQDKQAGYLEAKDTDIVKGLEYLAQVQQEFAQDPSVGTGIDGIYKSGVLEKTQKDQAIQALDYLYKTLPKNMKAVLEYKALEQGMEPAKGAKELLYTTVMSKTSQTNTSDLTLKAAAGKTGNQKKATSLEEALKLSPVMLMQSGLTEKENIRIQNGTSYSMEIEAQILPVMKSTSESGSSTLGTTSTLADVAKSSYGGVLNANQATMGGVEINPSAFKNVQVDATNLHVVCLPIDMREKNTTGIIKPDLDMLKRLETAQTAVRSLPDDQKTPEAINAIYQEHELPLIMDNNGQMNYTNYAKFGVFNGHALSKAFPKEKHLDIEALEINDQNTIDNIMDILNEGRDGKERLSFDSESFWDKLFGTEHDSIYEGTIYMPLRTNKLTGAISSGVDLTPSQAAQIDMLERQNDRIKASGGYKDGASQFTE